MKYFDLTLPSPAENLACDETLLELAEEGSEGEILRFWEPSGTFAVVGYANHAAREVNIEACHAAGIPVLRRFTGGGTVLQGPGCLNYSLILRIGENNEAVAEAAAAIPLSPDGGEGQGEGASSLTPTGSRLSPAQTDISLLVGERDRVRGDIRNPFHNIATTNKFILRRHQTAIGSLVKRPVRVAGQTDLAIGNRKFSGNAQRRHRRFLIFHGTFLLNFDLSLIERFLHMPSKQPDYREDRSHTDFLTNLNVPASDLKTALQKIWTATQALENVPHQRIRTLSNERYLTEAWNLKL